MAFYRSTSSGIINRSRKPAGLLKGRSVESVLLHLIETWKKAIDNGNHVGIIFVDFKKAFDSVNKDI